MSQMTSADYRRRANLCGALHEAFKSLERDCIRLGQDEAAQHKTDAVHWLQQAAWNEGEANALEELLARSS